jgi:hypothetical protein
MEVVPARLSELHMISPDNAHPFKTGRVEFLDDPVTGNPLEVARIRFGADRKPPTSAAG